MVRHQGGEEGLLGWHAVIVVLAEAVWDNHLLSLSLCRAVWEETEGQEKRLEKEKP